MEAEIGWFLLVSLCEFQVQQKTPSPKEKQQRKTGCYLLVSIYTEQAWVPTCMRMYSNTHIQSTYSPHNRNCLITAFYFDMSISMNVSPRNTWTNFCFPRFYLSNVTSICLCTTHRFAQPRENIQCRFIRQLLLLSLKALYKTV